jgi:hypothetical protein
MNQDHIRDAAAAARSAEQAIEAASRRRDSAVKAAQALIDNATAAERAEQEAARSALAVACHADGTTQADFLPGSWDHRSASYGTTRRVVTPVGRGRLFDLHVLVSGMEVADDGVPGGRRD